MSTPIIPIVPQLFIFYHSPYRDHSGQEFLELALTAASFNQPVQLAFLKQGLSYLLAAQDSAAIGRKPYTHYLKSLEFYDISPPLVAESDLADLGISPQQLLTPVTVCTQQTLIATLATYPRVLTC